ncbi:MAG TPA: PKD domain-containing protein [Chloroflexi bacterium]|nr:PKD domain-containing protein [Chloroflexota bacterium]
MEHRRFVDPVALLRIATIVGRRVRKAAGRPTGTLGLAVTSLPWKLGLPVAVALVLMGAVVALLGGASPARPAGANPAVLYVHPTCAGAPSPCYTTLQAAVDAASPGDEVRIAQGTYTGVQQRNGITQVVYLAKSLTLLGGWNGDFSARDPAAYPATVDAQGLGRAAVVSGPVTVTLDGLRLTGGDAQGLGGGGPLGTYDAGGGLFVLTATVTLSGAQVYGNVAPSWGEGGGIAVEGGNLTLVGGAVYSNTAWQGGGLALRKGEAHLTGTRFYSNVAPVVNNFGGQGGGVYIYDGTLTGATVEIRHNEGTWGGGLSADSAQVALDDAQVHHNQAVAGGGLYANSSALTLTGGAVFSNTAFHATTPSAADGGGLWVQGGGATLHGVEVHHNVASSEGGGLYCQGGCTVEGSEVHHNRAERGGGAYLTGASLTDNRFAANTAGEGGAIYAASLTGLQEANRIVGNVAGRRGGGLALEQCGAVWQNTLIADNALTETVGQGAGVWLAGFYEGGLVRVSSRFLHTTLADNAGGDGAGVLVTGTAGYAGQAWFTNTIVAGHTDGPGVWVAAGSAITLEATLWHANDRDVGGPGSVVTGTVNLHADPQFADPGAEDYHLTYGSPARDAGVEAGVTTDVDGERRPVGAAPDLGADEYPYGLSLTPVAAGATVDPGGVHVYQHTLQNGGGTTDTYTLTLASSRGWTSLVGSSVVTLGPGSSANVLLLAQVPADAPGLAQDVARLKAVSWGDPAVSATAVDTTTASCTAPSGADFTWSPSQPQTGQTVHFTATVAAGSSPMTYTWAFGDGGAGQGPAVVHTYVHSGTYAVRLTVANPCGQTVAEHPVTVTGESFKPQYGVTLTPTSQAKSALPGEAVVYTHTLCNTGNTADTYTVTVGSAQGWAALKSAGVVNLAPGATAVVTVEASVPVTAPVGTEDVATVRATSWAGPSITATARDTVTVISTEEYRLYLPLVMKTGPG